MNRREKVWLKNYPDEVPTEIDVSQYSSIVKVFDEACEKFSEKPAFSNLGTTISFAKFSQLSNQFAAFLQCELGLKKGTRIAIQLPNLFQYPIVVYGAFKCGLIIVNTNPLYTKREMLHQFKDSGAKVIVILSNYMHLLEGIISKTHIEHVIVTEVGDLLTAPKRFLINFTLKYVKKVIPKSQLTANYNFLQTLKLGVLHKYTAVDINHEDIAMLQYTGGTTGIAKGAILSHKNLVASMFMMDAWMRPKMRLGEDIMITALPLYHIFAFIVNLIAMVRVGNHNVLITNPRDTRAFIKELSKWRFSLLTTVNTLLIALLDHPNFARLDCRHLKMIIAGGMALQPSVAKRWQQATGVAVTEGYGMTETTSIVSTNRFDAQRMGSIGIPLPSVDVRIVDSSGITLPFGEIGELVVKGPQIMRGYWQSERGADAFYSGGWFKTGDMATMANDGYIKLVDRKKDMILVSGFNVYPNEIEGVVTELPNVVDAAAIGVPDEKSTEVVKLFVVPKSPDLTVDEVLHHCRQSLAAYKIPKVVEFRSELPKNNVGKILRRKLR